MRHQEQARAVVGDMPELSRFLGIVITMHYDDHAPPHFHVRYAGRKATLSIRPLEIYAAVTGKPIRSPKAG